MTSTTQRMYAEADRARRDANRLHAKAVEFERAHPPRKCPSCGEELKLARRYSDGGWWHKCDSCGWARFNGFLHCDHGPETTCTVCAGGE